MLHFLIATANYADSIRVKTQVRKILAAASIREEEDCVVREFSTRDTLRRYLFENGLLIHAQNGDGQADESDYALVIAQPALTDMEDTKPVLAQLLERSQDSVILLRLNNAGLGGVPIKSDRILTHLGESAMKRMRELIEQFLKDHELLEYNKYVGLLDEYKTMLLTPLHASGDEGSGGDDPGSIADPSVIERKWASLAMDMERKAESSVREAIAHFEKATARESYLSLASAFLHLWVETQLYGIRAKSNYQVIVNAHSTLNERQRRRRLGRIPRGYGVDQQARAEIEKSIADVTRSYYDTLKKYDKELKARDRAWKYFVRKFGDAEQFRAWSEDFGPKKLNPATEPGWDAHADRVSNLLYVKYREALGREYAQDGRTRGLAILYWLYWAVAGFGFAPERVIIVILSVLTLASGAQFADDYLSRCPSQTKFVNTPWGWVQNIGYYFHVSITSVTSMGTVATPCGPLHEIISGVETFSGYFLLAILTTLFVQSILER